MRKLDALRRPDGAFVHSAGEPFDRGDGVTDLGGDGRQRSQVWRTEPVVPHHALLVRVGDGPVLQGVHGLEGPLHRRGHPVEKAILEPHPADVERQPERRNLAEILLKPFPQNRCAHRCLSSIIWKSFRFPTRTVSAIPRNNPVPTTPGIARMSFSNRVGSEIGPIWQSRM